ncbi:hypothetical protein G9A89_022004 [Geosiphon pyriformis]|nr:hypothetical protein G9A89_022004 [Geosiphon pyriformis]
MSDDNTELVLPGAKFAGSNQWPLVISRVLEHCAFEPVKLFALDVELSNVSGKTNSNKLISIKKIFYHIDGFGSASTPSKFPGIIRLTFISESSLNKAKLMAINEKVVVNTDLKKKIIIKEISVNLLKSAIETVFSKFGKQKAVVEFESTEIAYSVHVTLVVNDKELWISRNHYRALLYTFPVGMTAHDLSDLVETYGGKTCVIGHDFTSYACVWCAVICFESKVAKLAAIGLVPVFKIVNLHWAGLCLACCIKCEQFGHVTAICPVGGNFGVHGKWVIFDQDRVRLAGIYKKKQALISFAGGVTSRVFSSGSFGTDLYPGLVPSLLMSNPLVVSQLGNCLAALKHSLEILADQVFGILKKLSFVKLVPLVPLFGSVSLVVSVSVVLVVNLDMTLDDEPTVSAPPFSGADESTAVLSSSGSRVFTSKMGGLESKMSALEASVSSVLARLDFFLIWKFATCNVRGINVPTKQADIVCWHVSSGNMVSFDKFDGVRIFTSGLDVGYLGAGVAVIMNNSLARHVSKVEEISGRVISVRLLFKSRLLVTLLKLYAGVSPGVRFDQSSEVNSLIAKTVNSSFFVILGGDFNENGSSKSASFKFCLDLGLVNSFFSHHLVGASTWSNSRGVGKTIDYIFVSSDLSSAMAGHQVVSVLDFFDTNHRAVVVSVGLGGLLDAELNSMHRQANRNHWKFKIKDADCLLLLSDVFSGAKNCGNVDAMWAVLEKVLVESANALFLRQWFSKFDCTKNRHSSKFFGLELLVTKVIKKFHSGNLPDINHLTCAFVDLLGSKVKSDVIFKHLSSVHRDYRRSKMFESRLTKEVSIRIAIEKCMENFCLNKGGMIKSVLERPFCKMVLDHLVVDNKLMLESKEVKSSVDKIMKGWTRKRLVHSYTPLDYVQDDAFSGIMCAVSMSELLSVVGGLPDGKAAGLSNGVLTNTRPIALIETARKILSKVLFNHISVVCSRFNVLQMFAVGSVVKNTIEKNREKAYNSVGWYHLRTSLWRVKMCERFIKFFGGIYKDRINRGEVFLPLLWRIFYDPLLCKVKRHKQLCGIEDDSGLTSYFSAGAFVNDTIWVGNCQASTQYALNIVSKFFVINDISINSEKTVAIPINQGVKIASLSICGQPILIAKKGESHCYLGIFLSTEGLSKPSVVKAHADIRFFVNVVLRKAITNKQFSYLVLADVLVRKCLRAKAHLPHNFSDVALYHSSLYGLKPFKQVQSEGKVAALIVFSNASSILGHLFSYRFLDLLCVNPVNNFLAGVVKIFLSNELSLVNNFLTAFYSSGYFPLLFILGKSLYFDLVKSFKHFGVAFGDQLFDKKGGLLDWKTFHCFSSSCSTGSDGLCGLDILGSEKFSAVKDGLHDVFTDGFLRNAGSAEVASSAVAYFLALDLSVGVAVHDLLSSTMAELQAVTLFLECVPFSSTVVLYLDSQVAIDACVSELSLVCSDFHNQCWLERHHIFNLIRDKDLVVSWVKVKDYSGVSGNERADLAAWAVSGSSFSLLAGVRKRFMVAKSIAVSSNACHFVRNIFWLICHTHWEAGPGYDVIPDALIGCIDWVVMAKVWHLDSHMLTGFTSHKSLTLHTYLMKAVHRRLLVAVRKRLYNKYYPGILCLLCGGVKFSDHAFTCVHESGIRDKILAEASAHWSALAGVFNISLSAVLQVLS